MVIVDASNMFREFEIDRLSSTIEFGSLYTWHDTTYVYQSIVYDVNAQSSSNAVTFNGTGFSVNAADELVSGAVTSISIDLDFDFTEDLRITGLNLSAVDLFNSLSMGTNSFWETILAGSTQIIQGDFEFDFYTDFIELSSGFFMGGDDTVLNGADVDNGRLVGDAFEINGTAHLIGGDDVLDTADIIEADVRTVSDNAVLIGGNDSIILTQDFTVDEGSTPGGTIAAIGDAGRVTDFGFVEGGDDLIDLRALSVGSATAVGDAFTILNDSFVIGGDDTIYGGANDDILRGDASSIQNAASLTAGNDIIYGGAGDDSIYGDFITNSSTGQVTGGNDELYGEAGNDEIYGNGGDDILDGGAGNDNLRGESGNDTLNGGDDNDIVDGGNGEDIIDGGAGNDTLRGGGNDDMIDGGVGIDIISAGIGNDTVHGGGNNDTILGQGDADTLYGDGGADTLRGGSGNDTLFGGDASDQLFGQGNNDILYGEAGNDTLSGAAGSDQLFGGAGNDTLNGSIGADRLDGGAGNDILHGGGMDGARDIFVFAQGYDEDRINAFDQAGADRIELDDALWASEGTLSAQEVIDMFGSLNATGTILTLDFGGGDILEVQNAEGIDIDTFGADILVI